MPSSIRATRDAGLRIRVAPEEVTVVDWPLRQRPVASFVALAIAGGASWLVGALTNNGAVGLGVAAVLAVTLWRTWLPVRYEIGSGGIVQRVWRWRRRIPWTAILRYEVKGDGVLLLPDAAATPISALRGLYLHWIDRKVEVLANLDYYLQGWQGSARASTLGQRNAKQPADAGQPRSNSS
jgi:hypothetical protein